MNKKLVIVTVAVFLLGIFGFIVFKRTLAKYRQEADKAMLWTGDYDKAIENYSKLIQWNDDNPGLYYLRGDAFTARGDYSNAVKDYETALELGVTNTPQTILRLSLAEIRSENYDIAEGHLKKLLHLSTSSENENWAANYHLGQIEYKKGNYQSAIKYYNQARSVQPSSFELYHRANAYFALGLTDSAVQDYNESIEFVKQDYVRLHPNSLPAQCDTCGFPFGSQQYELLTIKANGPAMKTLLEKFNSKNENKNNR